MEFGRLPLNELSQVDFSLPEDTPLTRKVLSGQTVARHPGIYTGCAKWGRKEWIGLIYPEKTKEANFLSEYVKHFNSIEMNGIFYAMPRPEQVSAWREKAESAGKEFLFCPKFPRQITHIKRLVGAEETTSNYLESMAAFGNYLGPAFLQLNDNFGPKNFTVLKNYLERLPEDFKVFVEVRHKDWFSDTEARSELFTMLAELKKGAVITDASGRRDCVHMELTIPEAFVRFVGNGLHPTDYERIDQWAERITEWLKSGLQSVYFFLHQHDEKDTPILADYTVNKLNALTDLKISGPKLIKKQNTLF